MSEVSPIDVGAVLDIEGEEYRVTNIWIDEDGVSHVTISHGTHDEKLAYSDVREALDDDRAERINSGHEAWQWRNN
jgi:hypothetical protein